MIAALTERLAAPPIALPAANDWPSLDRPTTNTAASPSAPQFDNGGSAGLHRRLDLPSRRRPAPAIGCSRRRGSPTAASSSSIAASCPRAGKDPTARAAGQIAGPSTIVGAMRWPDARHWFTPSDDPAHNLWFSRDPQAIAAAKGLGAVAPFYVEQETPVPPGGLPQPGKLVVDAAGQPSAIRDHLVRSGCRFGRAFSSFGPLQFAPAQASRHGPRLAFLVKPAFSY